MYKKLIAGGMGLVIA